MNRIGVAIVGVNGAVASTVIAGVELMKRGLVPRIGMVTERTDARIAESLTELLDFAPLESLVFGGLGPAVRERATRARCTTRCCPQHVLEQVSAELERITPWPAVFSTTYVEKLAGENVVQRQRLPRGDRHPRARTSRPSRRRNNLDRVVMVNLASTERFLEVQPVHQRPARVRGRPRRERPGHHAGDAVLLRRQQARHPVLQLHAEPHQRPGARRAGRARWATPFAGMDGKTGQTLLKTALASMFRARRLLIEGWYSTNFLGNSDGLVLDAPGSNKTKVLSKSAVLDSIVGYHVENHQVHIHYYKPRGDSKEAWDNIDIVGFAGIPMQIKVNFLCQDSALAAPLVIDLVRLLDVAKRAGERGIQRQLSMFFKSPYHAPGETPVHDLFKQEKLLLDWARAHATRRRRRAPTARSRTRSRRRDGARRARRPRRDRALRRDARRCSTRRAPRLADRRRTTSARAVARVLDRGILSGPFAPEAVALEEEFARVRRRASTAC